MNNLFDLGGKVAIVTGGARGIGKEIALTLAHAGADILIADILQEELVKTAIQLEGMTGKRIHHSEVDVRDVGSVNAMVQHALNHLGQVDILVNNAGIAKISPAEHTPTEEWLDIININLNGVYWCCRAVASHMLSRQSGAIVNIASMSGSIVNTPQPQAAYNASKAAVIHLTKSLAVEWADRGVRVNSVSPGYIGTSMVRRALDNVPDWERVWMDFTPMKRLGEPSEIAHAVWYLASPASSFATGTDLIVDGGYTSL